ncbi:CGNR zinc finger domain-containing protein [Streptomyces sp. NPDC047928]|uniref:CGNR zinc finger domain-containing protein n=1 Tax=unclassified Streptomyces TaxID=2593676 RepID=UPI0037111F01
MPHPARELLGDPRPLLGEPLPLDLVNTVWTDRHGCHDLLDTVAGLAHWLSVSPAVEPLRGGLVRPDPRTWVAVRLARAALAAAVADPADPRAPEALNGILARGRIRRELTPLGPRDQVEVDDPAQLLGWTAVSDYLGLIADNPHRVRACANGCGLYFHDTSRNGTRRWCSRAVCGNRVRAARHHARGRALRGSAWQGSPTLAEESLGSQV